MTMSAAPARLRAGLPLWPAIWTGCFVLLLALWSTIGLPDGPVETMVMGNDAGMRLLTLRDLSAGQGWFDARQPRLGLDGTEMHWSRLVDAPMLVLVAALEPVLGRAGAEYALLLVWPLAMLAAVLATCAMIARRLGGDLAALLTVGAGLLTLMLRWRFMPGDIDHHNVQVLLLVLALWGVLTRHESRWAAPGAGLAIAASLCVGVETLPLLTLLGLTVAGLWATGGEAERAPALGFTLGLGGGLTVLFPLTAPEMAWRGGFCDAISTDLAIPVLAGAALLAGLAWTLSERAAPVRGAALVGGGAALAAAVAVFMPTCLSNPYAALDPFLVEHWLKQTDEAKGIAMKTAEGELSYLVIAVISALAAIALPLTIGRAGLLPGALIGLGLAIATYQVRGLLSVVVLTVLALSVVAAILRDRAKARPAPATTGLSAAAVFLLAGAATLLGPGSKILEPRPTATASTPSCAEAGAWEALAALPPGRVANGSNAGVPILLGTGHSVLAAPYHRNQAGLRVAYTLMLAETDAEAEAVLRRTGADYVALCPGDGDVATLIDGHPDSFAARIAAGAVPAFLRPVPGTETAAARLFTVGPQS
ncbi:hypothetical protein [Jannaschia seohaensis]|uniref:4-amino-4-deoxy-L-arabinose transferase n=1 Tax=Jannaschia seohaensis TaxID=475081 RepID=A0A2Y9AYG6_9RHOB|nr:hypothetical protein [Jannaschia seohaensis]PWJ16173.1 hypothetical protein BCF38_10957 [Jannaschia seohaensis]SSA49176.1 hypothetical protein SAMN05421539_10957 [Jannaschia seohaensis]